ncbi:pheromone-regulated protein prm10 [Blastocladiella emersonii ATCC 22665]|nr:pheromone-regulated protein prm10 [Blastocladiella emersonii ATCC 22665]KAI9179969.1 pheromone-regulated protein prm10 [Blastocladiella emersonii ATCC 22665]
MEKADIALRNLPQQPSDDDRQQREQSLASSSSDGNLRASVAAALGPRASMLSTTAAEGTATPPPLYVAPAAGPSTGAPDNVSPLTPHSVMGDGALPFVPAHTRAHATAPAQGYSADSMPPSPASPAVRAGTALLTSDPLSSPSLHATTAPGTARLPSPASMPHRRHLQFDMPPFPQQQQQQQPFPTFPSQLFLSPHSPYHVPPDQLAHYNQAKAFVMKLGRALFSFGLPSFRLETDLTKAATALGLTAQFGVLPSSLQASFEHPWGFSEATMVNMAFGLDVGRLYFTNQLCHRLSANQIRLEEATAELEDIIQNGSLYGRTATLFAFAIGSFGGAPLAFNGGWHDTWASLVLGLLVGAMNMGMAGTSLGPLFEFAAATAVAFLTLAAQQWISPSICFTATTLSALLVPLPGLWISTSFIELSSRQIVSGACRMWWSLMIAFQLAFGLSIGYNLFGAVFGLSEAATRPVGLQCSHALHPLWNLLFLPLITLSLNILLNAHRHQYIPMTVSSSVSYLLFYVCASVLGFGIETTSLVVSFVIGIGANLYSRLTGGGAVEVSLSGIILLVPGSVATKYSVGLLDQKVSGVMSSGGEFAVKFVIVALAISVGQIAARIVESVDFRLEPLRPLAAVATATTAGMGAGPTPSATVAPVRRISSMLD